MATLLSWIVPLVVAALVMFLHRRQEAASEATVSSMIVWRQVLPTGRLRRLRPRRMASLLLLVGIAVCLAAALMQTVVPGTVREVLVLDNAFSMSALTSRHASRWQLAVREARRLVQAAPLDAQFLVLDTTGQRPLGRYVAREEALAQIDMLAVAPPGNRRLPAIPALHRGPVHLFTDGVRLPELAVPAHARLHRHLVFEAISNAALAAFELASVAAEPGHHEALVRLVNDSPHPAELAYTVEGRGVALRRTAHLAAGEMQVETFALRADPGDILRAKVFLQGDALAADDFADAIVPRGGRMRVLLVSSHPAVLETALRMLPGVELRTVHPDRYGENAQVDVYLFHRFSPAALPSAGVLHMGAGTSCTGSLATEPARALRGARWAVRDALAQSIDWGEVRVDRGFVHVLPVGQGAAVVAGSAGEGAPIWKCDGRRRSVILGFDLADSNLALQPGFPVFLAQAMHWVASGHDAGSTPVGVVTLVPARGTVTGEDGSPVDAFAVAGGTAFIAAAPGRYVSRAEHGARTVVARFDPPPTRVNGRVAARGPIDAELYDTGIGRLLAGGPEMLLAIALVLVLIWWIGRLVGIVR